MCPKFNNFFYGLLSLPAVTLLASKVKKPKMEAALDDSGTKRAPVGAEKMHDERGIWGGVEVDH